MGCCEGKQPSRAATRDVIVMSPKKHGPTLPQLPPCSFTGDNVDLKSKALRVAKKHAMNKGTDCAKLYEELRANGSWTFVPKTARDAARNEVDKEIVILDKLGAKYEEQEDVQLAEKGWEVKLEKLPENQRPGALALWKECKAKQVSQSTDDFYKMIFERMLADLDEMYAHLQALQRKHEVLQKGDPEEQKAWTALMKEEEELRFKWLRREHCHRNASHRMGSAHLQAQLGRDAWDWKPPGARAKIRIKGGCIVKKLTDDPSCGDLVGRRYDGPKGAAPVLAQKTKQEFEQKYGEADYAEEWAKAPTCAPGAAERAGLQVNDVLLQAEFADASVQQVRAAEGKQSVFTLADPNDIKFYLGPANDVFEDTELLVTYVHGRAGVAAWNDSARDVYTGEERTEIVKEKRRVSALLQPDMKIVVDSTTADGRRKHEEDMKEKERFITVDEWVVAGKKGADRETVGFINENGWKRPVEYCPKGSGTKGQHDDIVRIDFKSRLDYLRRKSQQTGKKLLGTAVVRIGANTELAKRTRRDMWYAIKDKGLDGASNLNVEAIEKIFTDPAGSREYCEQKFGEQVTQQGGAGAVAVAAISRDGVGELCNELAIAFGLKWPKGPPGQERVDAVFSAVDLTGRGVVGFKEFYPWYRRELIKMISALEDKYKRETEKLHKKLSKEDEEELKRRVVQKYVVKDGEQPLGGSAAPLASAEQPFLCLGSKWVIELDREYPSIRRTSSMRYMDPLVSDSAPLTFTCYTVGADTITIITFKVDDGGTERSMTRSASGTVGGGEIELRRYRSSGGGTPLGPKSPLK